MRRLAAGHRLDRAGVMVQEHLGTGGKRLRARLALAAATALGVGPGARAWAEAVELLHNATLIHDDIQDGDRVRRGQPTTWVRHGVAQAINAGDLMLMLPFLAISRGDVPVPVQAALSACLAEQAAATVRGQTDELHLLPGGHTDQEAYDRFLDDGEVEG
ncbi:MAG: polyprenyl synthetase family protein, partial [Myxococcota bacterium]|nr:polyprenyl synthetase family protein [Myxococcota bacterium]